MKIKSILAGGVILLSLSATIESPINQSIVKAIKEDDLVDGSASIRIYLSK